MSEGMTGQANQPAELIAAAHELKSPLTLIAHMAATLRDADMGWTPAEQAVALERIQLSAERTLRLVQGLTVSYRLAQESQLGLAFTLEPLNIAQICQEAAHEIAPLAAAYNQTLQLRVSRSHLVVANNDLVRSIIFNLLDNALRHNPAQAAVRVSLRSHAAVTRLCVQDSGPGFAPGDLKRLNQTLGKRPQPLSGRAGSSGLGLYIASVMAETMGGRLGVGRTKIGADFHLDLLPSKQTSFL